MEHKLMLLSLVVLVGSLIQYVQGDAVISLQFIRYENKKGVGSNGHCCDGKWGICQSNGCDHKFTICMGNYTSPNDTKDCTLGKFQSGQIKNENTNNFTRTIADLRNPLLFNVTGRLPDGVTLKVDVYDSDKGTSISDHVDFLIYRAATKLNSNYVFTIRGTTAANTTLFAQMMIQCVNKTVGQRCEAKEPRCPSPGPMDHYKCQSQSGNKICTDGYMGKNCELPPPAGRPSGPSRPNSIPGNLPSGPAPGGRPSPGSVPARPSGGASVPGFPSPTGGLPAPAPALPSPNGGRPSGPSVPSCPPPRPGDHYTCDPRTGAKICNGGYTGTNCDYPPSPVPNSPSPNVPSGPSSPEIAGPSGSDGGRRPSGPNLPSPSGPGPNFPSGPVCEPPRAWDHYACDPATGRKICKDGFTGTHCELPPNPPNSPTCQPPRAWDHYTCDPRTGRKICKDGFSGLNCEIPPSVGPNIPTCEPPRSWDHYVCDPRTGQKICQDGYTGVHCEIPPRTSGTSTGSSNCKPPTAWDHYKCDPVTGYPVCNPGWTGTDCNLRSGSSSRPSSSGGSSFHTGSDSASFPGSTSRLCTTPRIGDHYICDSSYTRKLCTDGYTGTNCDIPPSSGGFPSGGFPSGGFPTFGRIGTSRRPVDPPVAPSPGNAAQRAHRPTYPSYIARKADCDRIAELERDYRGVSGVFDIQPTGVARPFPVYCVMTSDGRGWTQIQRREENGLTDFNRNWLEYKMGFGEVGRHAEDWIGLENLHAITSQRSYKLRIDIQGDDMQWRYAAYDRFSVDGERDNYRLHVSGFDPRSTAGDALQGSAGRPMHDGMAFSTPDRDNDGDARTNCAQKFESGWWFNACLFSNLNGPQRMLGDCTRYDGKCVAWYANNRNTVRAVRMAILPS